MPITYKILLILFLHYIEMPLVDYVNLSLIKIVLFFIFKKYNIISKIYINLYYLDLGLAQLLRMEIFSYKDMLQLNGLVDLLNLLKFLLFIGFVYCIMIA